MSIGKLGHGQERYYIESVATGAEDYYLGGEAPGVWAGSAAATLGLASTVDGAQLSAVLAGLDPATGEQLGKAHKIPGFDLTFRAPKSVSILFGIAEPEIARAIRDAHDEAVAAALDFVERHAAWTRRGAGGVEQVRVNGLTAAAFRHRTSRAGDPHLHTHVVVANTVRGSDGRWSTLDARHLYANAKTVGHLYEAELRHRLTRRLGVCFGEVHNGIADIDGVPASLMATMSTRRAQIDEAMAIQGAHSARAAQVATLATRRAKHDVDSHTLATTWTATAAAHGLGPREIAGLLHVAEPDPLPPDRRLQIEHELASEDGMTAKRATFDRNRVLEAWCDRLPAGATIDTLEHLADHFLASDPVVRLDGRQPGAVIRDQRGRILSALPATTRYSTVELLDLEADAVDRALRLLGQHIAVPDWQHVRGAINDDHRLSAEQVHAVVAMTCSGNGVEVLTAPAGAGKTTALATARDAWERSGYRVIGAAHTGVAADELANAAGIPSTTIARLHITLDNGLPGGLDPRTVLVVDEAGNAGTRSLARLLRHAETAKAKVVLLGDPRQLPEIDAGGLFAGLIARQPAIQLHDNHRQRHEWEQAALRQLRGGDIPAAIAAYDKHGRIISTDTAHDSKARLVADFWAFHLEGDDAIMLASRRVDVAELNCHARIRAADAHHLTGPTLTVEDRDFQRGDRVLMLRNNRRLHVRNGNRGTVLAVDPDTRTMTVQLARRVVELDANYLDAGHVDHGYAMTVHKSQGLTCDHTLVLGSDDLYQELGYTALSRGRHTNTIYLTTATPDPERHGPDRTPEEPLVTLERALQQRHAQRLALDHQTPAPPSTWSLAQLNAERSRLRAVFADAPPERTSQLAKLAERRDYELGRVAVVDEYLAALPGPLAARHRSSTRHRRRHLTGQRAELIAGIEKLDTEALTVQAAQHQRASYLAAHTADRQQLDRLDRELIHRINRAVTHDANQPPSYILERIGPRPGPHHPADRHWLAAVHTIETYRAEHDITDPEHLAGAEPPTNDTSREWYAVLNSVHQARRHLALEQPTPAPVVPIHDVPSLGL